MPDKNFHPRQHCFVAESVDWIGTGRRTRWWIVIVRIICIIFHWNLLHIFHFACKLEIKLFSFRSFFLFGACSRCWFGRFEVRCKTASKRVNSIDFPERFDFLLVFVFLFQFNLSFMHLISDGQGDWTFVDTLNERISSCCCQTRPRPRHLH